jgi:MFS family permease
MSGALLAAWIDSPAWRQRLYGLGVWGAVAVTAAMGLSSAWPWWAVLRYLGGLCGAAGMLLGSGLVLGWLMRAGRRPELGLYFVGIGLGIVVSAVSAWAFGRLWPHWAEQWWALGGVGLVFLGPAWRWRPPVPPAPASHAEGGPGPSRRWLWTMVAAYFAAGWGFVINATFTVAIVERQPALAGQGPLAWGLVGLAAMPAVALWDRVARRVGEKRALLAAFALQTAAVLAPALSPTLSASLLGALGYGATFIGLVSLTLALAGRRSPRNPGKAMARLTLSYGAAQVAAPAVAGAMAQASGSFHGALWLTAVVLAAGMAVLSTLPGE